MTFQLILGSFQIYTKVGCIPVRESLFEEDGNQRTEMSVCGHDSVVAELTMIAGLLTSPRGFMTPISSFLHHSATNLPKLFRPMLSLKLLRIVPFLQLNQHVYY